MTLLSAPTLTSAERSASANYAANLAALCSTQPDLAGATPPPREELEWVFARDGYLTARDETGTWWSGCSIPRQTAAAMLKKMDQSSPVSCFLAPPHAAQLRIALDKLSPSQAVLAIVPEESDLRVLLACDDFSAEIAGHRLWLFSGTDWADALFNLLDLEIGLAIPSKFIRLPMLDEALVSRLIEEAQKVFSRLTNRRSEQLTAFRERHTPSSKVEKLCIMAPSRFRLWNDEGQTLANTFSRSASFQTRLIDTDDPAASSPLKLAQMACESDALITPNFARADLANALPMTLPWISWITNERIPRFDLAGPNDRLLMTGTAAQSSAIIAGWPASRVHLAGWPQATTPITTAASHLTVLADTVPIELPDDLEDFSSHRVFWSQIYQDLRSDPFSLQGDPLAYLAALMKQYQISTDGFPFDRFIHSLILPTYQQTLVAGLIQNGLPVQLFGTGWDTIPDFAPHAAGRLDTRTDLDAAIRSSAMLVHVWPTLHPHPIDAMGRPVVRRTGRQVESFIRDAKLALSGKHTPPQSVPTLSADQVRTLLD